MKVLVTGASGIIGSAACQHLAAAGFEVLGTDIVYKKGLGVPLRLADLRRPEAAYGPLEGCDALLHLGNLPNQNRGTTQEVYTHNTTININMFQAAADLGVKKVIFSSSVQAFSAQGGWYKPDQSAPAPLPYLPLDGALPANPGNGYALSKVAGEQALAYFCAHQGLSGVSIRLPALCLEEWIEWALKRPGLRGSVYEAFSYILLPDVCRLFESILRADLPGHRIYFPTACENFMGETPAALVERFYRHIPLRVPAERMPHLVDWSDITRDTGWEPTRRHIFTKEAPAAPTARA